MCGAMCGAALCLGGRRECLHARACMHASLACAPGSACLCTHTQRSHHCSMDPASALFSAARSRVSGCSSRSAGRASISVRIGACAASVHVRLCLSPLPPIATMQAPSPHTCVLHRHLRIPFLQRLLEGAVDVRVVGRLHAAGRAQMVQARPVGAQLLLGGVYQLLCVHVCARGACVCMCAPTLRLACTARACVRARTRVLRCTHAGARTCFLWISTWQSALSSGISLQQRQRQRRMQAPLRMRLTRCAVLHCCPAPHLCKLWMRFIRDSGLTCGAGRAGQRAAAALRAAGGAGACCCQCQCLPHASKWRCCLAHPGAAEAVRELALQRAGNFLQRQLHDQQLPQELIRGRAQAPSHCGTD